MTVSVISCITTSGVAVRASGWVSSATRPRRLILIQIFWQTILLFIISSRGRASAPDASVDHLTDRLFRQRPVEASGRFRKSAIGRPAGRWHRGDRAQPRPLVGRLKQTACAGALPPEPATTYFRLKDQVKRTSIWSTSGTIAGHRLLDSLVETANYKETVRSDHLDLDEDSTAYC